MLCFFILNFRIFLSMNSSKRLRKLNSWCRLYKIQYRSQSDHSVVIEIHLIIMSRSSPIVTTYLQQILPGNIVAISQTTVGKRSDLSLMKNKFFFAIICLENQSHPWIFLKKLSLKSELLPKSKRISCYQEVEQ